MKQLKTGIFWFTNDLRLHDNPALMQANSLLDELLCVYVIDHRWRSSSHYSRGNISQNTDRFLHESLSDLDNSLRQIGQQLIIIQSQTAPILSDLIKQLDCSYVFRSNNAGWYENRAWNQLKKAHPDIGFHSVDSHTLYDPDMLPFKIAELPTSFTKFKHAVSDIEVSKPIVALNYLPPPPSVDYIDFISVENQSIARLFEGGESQGLAHLNAYFATEKPMFYKQVRNSIDGWDNSCKLSPWLANGCLSVREVRSALTDYENNITANESTYWIYFELLWREYFQWYAHKNGSKLFSFRGIKRLSPLTSFYPERFQKWVNGSTPYPLVNACMNELRKTGYISNRGRQIVASCFVNELAMDWRYGAAYFEQVLLDYDVASNWGNWQYLAGIGADTRDKRHFNLDKQTQQFDPDGRYIRLWNGNKHLQPLDSVDAADWPIS
ncbi:MAG: deoxyribodipyrimidine photo-lyase [Arenicella sp.]|jgi:deoxyribodipyrimidine photo-lyase